MSTTLYYIHDPMCSWCWGYRPTWDALQQSLPDDFNVEYIAGGLAPDSDTAMPMAQQKMIQNHWRTIEQKLGTAFNHSFWASNVPRRSTYNACRAAIAAHNQGFQKAMIDAIQRGYYLRALNPSDLDVLISLAKELATEAPSNFDCDVFKEDLMSDETEKVLNEQINLASVLSQQGFPSLVLEHKGKRQQIAIDYVHYQQTLKDIINRIR